MSTASRQRNPKSPTRRRGALPGDPARQPGQDKHLIPQFKNPGLIGRFGPGGSLRSSPVRGAHGKADTKREGGLRRENVRNAKRAGVGYAGLKKIHEASRERSAA